MEYDHHSFDGGMIFSRELMPEDSPEPIFAPISPQLKEILLHTAQLIQVDALATPGAVRALAKLSFHEELFVKSMNRITRNGVSRATKGEG